MDFLKFLITWSLRGNTGENLGRVLRHLRDHEKESLRYCHVIYLLLTKLKATVALKSGGNGLIAASFPVPTYATVADNQCARVRGKPLLTRIFYFFQHWPKPIGLPGKSSAKSSEDTYTRRGHSVHRPGD